MLQLMRRYSTEEAARAYFERVRWPNGPVCPHCGNSEKIYARAANANVRTRPGLYKCGGCNGTFTVKVGTVMEDSKITLNKWLLAFYMMCASKTQVPVLQLQRQLEIGSYRSALSMCRRIRFALMDINYMDKRGGDVEAEVPLYKKIGAQFASHNTVNHGQGEYVRRGKSGRLATADATEGFVSNSKRSLDGICHYVSSKYLPFYLTELDFKYNTRNATYGARTSSGIRKIVGKRLMLRRPAGKK